jgi:flagellin
MSLRINTNVPSLVAQHRLETNKNNLDHTQNKLSSGTRIVKAMDDAAGLAISESLRATLRATDQNIKEAHNGVFVLHTVDGALNYITDMVIRMKELAVQASSDTNGDKEKGYLNNEVQSLKDELDRISKATRFNGRPLLNGEGGALSIQVGPNNVDDTDRITVNADFEINTNTLGISGVDISSTQGARDSLDTITAALDVIATTRGIVGAGEASLSNTISNLSQYEETMAGAFSQIRDADLAVETAEQAKYSILTQAGVAVLAQANNSPQLALKLLS